MRIEIFDDKLVEIFLTVIELEGLHDFMISNGVGYGPNRDTAKAFLIACRLGKERYEQQRH